MTDKTGISAIGTASADEHHMAQIREILFGEQARQTARELERLGTRLVEQEQQLRTLLDERIDGLTRAVDALRNELASQGDGQQAALTALETALHGLLEGLSDRVTLLDSDLQDGNHRLRQAIAEQDAALQRMQQRSVGRAQLAELLEALARQLRTPDAP